MGKKVKLKRFESVIYDVDFVNEVNSIIDSIKNSKLSTKYKVKIWPARGKEYKDRDEFTPVQSTNGFLFFDSIGEGKFNLFTDVEKFIRSNEYEEMIGKDDCIYTFAITLDLISDNFQKKLVPNVYLYIDNYLEEYTGVTDGDKAWNINIDKLNNELEQKLFLKNLFSDLMKKNYLIYQYDSVYIIIKNETSK